MDREIKFRAWDKTKKKMTRVFALSAHGKLIIWDGKENRTWDNAHGNRANSFSIMQYTGLKDKNGKEIYEGDLIKDNSGIMKAMRVEWGEHRPGFYDVVGFSFENIKNIEVIGNIYENPELTK